MRISQGTLGVQLILHSAIVIHEMSLDVKRCIKFRLVSELKAKSSPGMDDINPHARQISSCLVIHKVDHIYLTPFS